MRDLGQVIKNVLERYIDVLNQRIESRWQSWEDGTFTEHSVIPPAVKFTSDSIDVLLEYTGLGAWILEFGSGSLMTTNKSNKFGQGGNPWLGDYLNSDRYNSDRRKNGNAFTGRAKGDTIYAPDGSTKISKGGRKGRNLEALPTKEITKVYYPEPALHLIEHEIEFWIPEVEEAIQQAVGDYLLEEIEGAFTQR